MGAFAVAEACCEPVSQSNTEQLGSYSALTSAAVPWCCITAHLHRDQISIGVLPVAEACCEPVLQSSKEQQGSSFATTSGAVLRPGRPHKLNAKAIQHILAAAKQKQCKSAGAIAAKVQQKSVGKVSVTTH